MSHYVVGDIQGCYAEFQQLLDVIAFDPATRLAVAGRRPRQPRPRFARGAAHGQESRSRRGHRARQSRLALADRGRRSSQARIGRTRWRAFSTRPTAMSCSPGCARVRWWCAMATCCSSTRVCCRRGRRRPPKCCRGKSKPCWPRPDTMIFCAISTATSPRAGTPTLTGYDRLRVIVNACTRLRFCAADDTMELSEKRGIAHTPEGYAPWFLARRTQIGRRNDPVRTLVDARSDAGAQCADARLRMPVGRHADRAQARRSPPVSGAWPLNPKAARIACSASRDSSRRCRACAASAGISVMSTTIARSPSTRQKEPMNVVSPTYAGASL